MSVDKVNGKQILINEVNRLNGIEIGEEAIDLIFDTFKDEGTNTVDSGKLKDRLCTIYSLDRDDEQLMGYIEDIAKKDGLDGISLDDLNGEYEYNQPEDYTEYETKEEKMHETGLQSVARFLGYQGIDVSSEDIETAFNECPSDKDFATYLKEKYQVDSDDEQLNKILQQISSYKESNAVMTREDLTTTSTVDGEEMTGAQCIANGVNKRLHGSSSVSADDIISSYDEYAAQGDEASNEGFAKFILNKYSLSGSAQNFVTEQIDLAAKFNGSLELDDLKAYGDMTISYQVEVAKENTSETTSAATPATADMTTAEQEDGKAQDTDTENATETNPEETQTTTTASTSKSNVEGTTVTLENGVVTKINLSNGTVIDITDNNANGDLKINDTVNANGVLTSKIIEAGKDTVYVYYQDGSVYSIYLNSLSEGGIYNVQQTQSSTTTVDNNNDGASNTQGSQNDGASQETASYAPMTPPEAARTSTSTIATSSKASRAKIGYDTDGTIISVTLNDGTVFDLTDELFEGITGENDGKTTGYTTYYIEDKGVTVKDGNNGGERQIITPDGTTLYIYYEEETKTPGSIYVDEITGNSGKIYVSSSYSTNGGDDSTGINADVDELIETVTQNLGSPFDDEVEETTDENGNKVSIQQYERGSIETVYDEEGNEISKIIKDEEGNITAEVEYGESTVVTEYTGKDNDGNDNYIKTTKDEEGNTTTEIKDFNIVIKSDENDELTIIIDGKQYSGNIVQSSDTKYSYTVNDKTYYFVKGTDGSWSCINSDDEEATPEAQTMTSFLERLNDEEQTKALQIYQEIAGDGVKKKEITEFLKEEITADEDPFIRMAVLELLCDGNENLNIPSYKSEVKSAMASNDYFLKNGIEYMLYKVEEGTYSIEDIIDFENRYADMNQTDDLWDAACLTKKDMLDLYLDIYKTAQDTELGGGQEAIENANENLHFSISELAKEIQAEYSGDKETERLTNLLDYAGFNEDALENLEEPSDYEDLKNDYKKDDNKDTLLAVLEGLDSGDLKNEEALYLLADTFGKDASNLMTAFRKLKDGEQEDYIESLYEAVTYKTGDNENVLKETSSTKNSSSALERYLSQSYNKDNALDFAREIQKDEDLTPEDRLEALEKISGTSPACGEIVEDEFISYYNPYKKIFINDISTLAQGSGGIDAIENYAEGCCDLAYTDSISFMYNYMFGVADIGIQHPEYFNMLTDVFTYQKDNITSENVEELEKTLCVNGFITMLSEYRDYLTQSDEQYFENVFDAIGEAEIETGVYKIPEDTSIIQADKSNEVNRNNILKALAKGTITDDTAKELLIYIYCDKAKQTNSSAANAVVGGTAAAG